MKINYRVSGNKIVETIAPLNSMGYAENPSRELSATQATVVVGALAQAASVESPNTGKSSYTKSQEKSFIQDHSKK